MDVDRFSKEGALDMKKKVLMGFLIIALATLFLNSLPGCESPEKYQNLPEGKSYTPPGQTSKEIEMKWAEIKKSDNTIWISEEWEKPVNLGSPVNTLGWEDSASISPDGNVLSFTYMRLDPLAYIHFGKRVRVHGPPRLGWPKTEPFDSFGADIYIVKKVNGVWQEPQPVGPPVNLPETADGDQWLSVDENRIYFNSAEGNRAKGIYFAERKNNNSPWHTLKYLNKHINSGREDENPYLSADERFLYFESARPGGMGGKDLYVSEEVNGEWQTPKNLGPKINTKEDEVQPFISLDGKILLFSRNQMIYRSRKMPDSSWSTPEVIVRGHVGEPTLTESGDLYFVHVYIQENKEFDCDIMMAKAKRSR